MAENTLLRELRQKKPFASPQEEASVALLRTVDMLRWRMAEVLEPEGISPAQFNVLRILRGAGADGLPTLEIGERLVEQAPGVTRLIDRLEAQGLVGRARTASDRRQVLCHIEKKGLDMLSRLDATTAESREAIFAGVSKAEVVNLITTLAAIRKACAARCPSLKKH